MICRRFWAVLKNLLKCWKKRYARKNIQVPQNARVSAKVLNVTVKSVKDLNVKDLNVKDLNAMAAEKIDLADTDTITDRKAINAAAGVKALNVLW